MRIKAVQSLSNLKSLEDLVRYVSGVVQDLVSVINGNISLTDNTSGAFVDVTFSAANTDVQVNHGIRGTPTGYIPVSRSASITIYDGSQSNTSEHLYVRASGAGTARLYVF